MKRASVQQPGTLIRSMLRPAGMIKIADREPSRPQRPLSPATPLEWQRYIDSRLRQFGVTR